MSWILLTAMFLGADAFHDTFVNAGNAYTAGDYATAAQSYEQLINEGVVDAAVFYNLGNAYYRSGRFGPAIANYERALRLEPGFENAWENLSKAVRETKNQLSRPAPPEWEQSLLFWHYGLSKRATTLLALTFWIAFWVALGIREWRPVRYLRRTAAVVGLFALAFSGSAWAKAHPTPLAVASADTVPVHYGTNEHETVRFELGAGDRVIVDKRVSGWARVETVDGERGWAQDQYLTFVGPPYEPPAAPAPTAEAAPPR